MTTEIGFDADRGQFYTTPVPQRPWIDIFAESPREVQAAKVLAVFRAPPRRPHSASYVAQRMGLPVDYVVDLMDELNQRGDIIPAGYVGRYVSAK